MTRCDECNAETDPGVPNIVIPRAGDLNFSICVGQAEEDTDGWDEVEGIDLCSLCARSWLLEALREAEEVLGEQTPEAAV